MQLERAGAEVGLTDNRVQELILLPELSLHLSPLLPFLH